MTLTTEWKNTILADWKTYLKGELPNKFNKYSVEDTRDGPGNWLSAAVDYIEGRNKDFIDTINDAGGDWWADQSYQSFKENMPGFLALLNEKYEWETPQDRHEELTEISSDENGDFRTVLDDMLMERMVDNWWLMLDNIPLLVYPVNDTHSLGWTDGENGDVEYEMSQNPALKEFYLASGLDLAKFKELVANGFDYDVQGFIGGIVDAADLLKAKIEDVGHIQVDQPIVAFHNGLNGSGYYVESKKPVSLDLKKKLSVDWGSYSLGDVFGARDWTWRAR